MGDLKLEKLLNVLTCVLCPSALAVFALYSIRLALVLWCAAFACQLWAARLYRADREIAFANWKDADRRLRESWKGTGGR
jgi:hypothetical protein